MTASREAGTAERRAPERHRRLGHLRRQDLLGAPAGEGRAPGQHLVAQNAGGVDVHPVIELGIGGGLLRRHVGRRAQGDARGGERLPAGRLAHRLGHPEVGHQGVPAAEHHVVRLDVPVHHPLGVGRGQGVHHLGQDLDGVVDREFALPGQPVAQRFPGDVGHHEPVEPVAFAGIEQGQDMGMLQPGGDLDFPEEPLAAEGGGDLGPEDLHRHLAVMPQVFGQVDRGHPPAAELALDGVAVPEGGLQTVEVVGHACNVRRKT